MRKPLFFLLLLLPAAAAAQGLAEAVDAAWARDPQARLLDARRAELAARVEAAGALTPEPAAVSLGARTDRWSRDRGQQELDVELGAPLWLPGQRDAAQTLAARELAQLEVQRRAQRLQIAGAVREAWLAQTQARRDLEIAGLRLANGLDLERDLARRLAVGEVSRLDANQGEVERLAAESAQAQAQARLREASLALQALTGSIVEHDMPEEPEAVAPDENPRLAAGRLGVAVARARLRAAQSASRANPELALALRRERAAADEAYEHTLGVRLRVPFASAPRQRERDAAAQAELDAALAELSQLELRLPVEAARARADADAALLQLEGAERRRRLAAESLALARKAYRLGESDLASLLRVQAAVIDAERDAAASRIALAGARGRLHQALGVLP